MAARRMNLAFVPTNSRRVFFFGRHNSVRDKMSRMLTEFVDPDPDLTAAAAARDREEPVDDDEDDEEEDDKQDKDDDEDDDGNSDGYSE